MTVVDSAAAKFWNREVVAPTHSSWMAHPDVRAYINESISGLRDPKLRRIRWEVPTRLQPEKVVRY